VTERNREPLSESELASLRLWASYGSFARAWSAWGTPQLVMRLLDEVEA